MTITSLVVLQSKYRTKDSRSTSDFTVNIGQSIEVSRIAVKSIYIPNSRYNINQYTNKIVVNGIVVTIPLGQYGGQAFRDVVSEAIGLAIGDTTFVLTRGNITGKSTLTSTVVPTQISVDPIRSPMSKILGFTQETLGLFPPTGPLLTYDSQNLSDLSGLNQYFVASKVLSQGFNGLLKNGEQRAILVDVPITSDYGTIQVYEPSDINLNIKTYVRPQNIQEIDIQILDQDLRVVDLNGVDCEIVIKIFE